MSSYGAGFGFTGEQTDPDGQVYLRARYYDPALRTFTSLDPFAGLMQRPMSLNDYAWVEGNPVNRVDPSGLFSRIPSDFYQCGRQRIQYLHNNKFTRGTSDDPCRLYWRRNSESYVACLRANNRRDAVCPYGEYNTLPPSFSDLKYGTEPFAYCGGIANQTPATDLWDKVWGLNNPQSISCDSFIGTFVGTAIDVGLGTSEELINNQMQVLISEGEALDNYRGSNISYVINNTESIASVRHQVEGFARFVGGFSTAMDIIGVADTVQRTNCYINQGREKFALAFIAYETAKFGVATFAPYGWTIVLGFDLVIEPAARYYSRLTARGIVEGFHPQTWLDEIIELLPMGCLVYSDTGICLYP